MAYREFRVSGGLHGNKEKKKGKKGKSDKEEGLLENMMNEV